MRYLVGIVGLALLAATGCTTTTPAQDTATAQLQYCSDLNALKTDVLALQNLSPTSSVGQVRDGVNKIQDDMHQVSNSAHAYKNAKIDQLNTSYNNLAKGAQGVPDNSSVQAAVVTITPQLLAVKDAQTTEMGSNCK